MWTEDILNTEALKPHARFGVGPTLNELTTPIQIIAEWHNKGERYVLATT